MSKLRPVVLSGPSGCGKSTIIKKLMSNHPNMFGFSVSHTTRKPRPGEVNGKDYHFTDRATMQAQVDRGEFIETAVFSNNMYGTSKRAVEDVIDSGLVCIMDIDSQGVQSVKKTDLNALLIFIKPPTIEDLEKRLKNRGTETEELIKRRLAISKGEFEYAAQPGSYHYTIINDVVDDAYMELKDIIAKEIGVHFD